MACFILYLIGSNLIQAIVVRCELLFWSAHKNDGERQTNEWKIVLKTPHLQLRELSIIYIIENEKIPSLISLCARIDVDRRKGIFSKIIKLMLCASEVEAARRLQNNGSTSTNHSIRLYHFIILNERVFWILIRWLFLNVFDDNELVLMHDSDVISIKFSVKNVNRNKRLRLIHHKTSTIHPPYWHYAVFVGLLCVRFLHSTWRSWPFVYHLNAKHFGSIKHWRRSRENLWRRKRKLMKWFCDTRAANTERTDAQLFCDKVNRRREEDDDYESQIR